MKLSLGFSPCPNDTFMFDALVNHKINHNFSFDLHMEDIEKLNNMAFNSQLDVTKISYHALVHLTDEYQILNCGSALGFNCGPLLLSKNDIDLSKIDQLSIAIPGKFTTANMLLELAFPNAHKKEAVLFSKIEDKLVSGQYDMGLVIHENRFTYQQKGLKKIMDLGAFWEEKTKSPIPLGAIVIKRSLPENIKKSIEKALTESVQFAFDHPKSGLKFIKDNAQAMDEDVMYKHIDLYVNKYSINLGNEGRESVQKLFELMMENNKIITIPGDLFVSN